MQDKVSGDESKGFTLMGSSNVNGSGVVWSNNTEIVEEEEQMKSNKKLWIIGIVVIVIIILTAIIISYIKNPTRLTIEEKNWINDNKNPPFIPSIAKFFSSDFMKLNA